MGLDFDHGEAHWAYSGFNRFRRRLADAIGINLDKMEGYAGWNILSSKPDAESAKDAAIPWDTVHDPIVPLLNHSDCDGELTPEECAAIAPRLRELVANWDWSGHDHRNAILLAEAMEECAAKGEPLGFC